MHLSALIIDFHAHPWTRQFAAKNNYFVSVLELNGLTMKSLPSNLEDLEINFQNLRIQKMIFFAQHADARLNPSLRNFTISNSDLAKIADDHRFIVPFGSINPNEGIDAFVGLKRDIIELGLKGICIFTPASSVYPSAKLMYILYDLCVERSIPIVFHPAALDLLHCDMKYGDPIHIDEVARDFPELKIIIAHAGWPWTETAVAIAMRNSNVYLDVQPLPVDKQPLALINYIRRTKGKRVVFGSNYPLISDHSFFERVEAYFRKVFGNSAAEDILHNNAKKILAK